MYFTYRTKRYKVEQDPYNIILQKHRTKKAKDGTVSDSWEIVGYYSSFESLLKKLLKEGVFEEKEAKNMMISFNTAVRDLSKQLNTLIKANLNGVQEEISDK